MWMINAILLLHGFLYYSIVIILPLFLSEEFGFSDTLAGVIYGGMGCSFTVFAILLGTTIDQIGVRVTEIFSSLTLCIGTLMLAFSYNKILMMFAVLFFLPLGGSVGVPTVKIAIRRFTTPGTRSVAFSIVFMVMNLSAVMGFASDDVFTHKSSGATFTPYRQIMFLGGCLMIIAGVLSACLREIDFEASGEEQVSALGKNMGHCKIIKDLVQTKGFWRYVLLVVMAIGIRIVYRSLDATLPKYMERTIGEDAYYGTILMLNPLTILIFTPIFTPLVYFFSNYILICIGGLVCAASCAIMLLPPSYW
jgi:MFS family permease